MSDYIVYKIYKDGVDYVYVGSTKAFNNRKYKHKERCNNETNKKNYNCKIYTIIRDNGGWDTWNMVKIDEIKDCSLTESQIKEQEWIDKLKANMNTNNAHETEELFKERKQIEDKKYHENHKEIISERKKEKITCKCGCNITKGGLSQHIKTKKHINLIKK